MKLIAFALVGVATLAGVIALTAPAANQESAPIFVTVTAMPWSVRFPARRARVPRWHS